MGVLESSIGTGPHATHQRMDPMCIAGIEHLFCPRLSYRDAEVHLHLICSTFFSSSKKSAFAFKHLLPISQALHGIF